METNIVFTNDNYPKSYGSIDKNNYRLNAYSDFSEKELEKIERQLWDFICQKAKATEPLKDYKDYEFFAAGWEWSVFKKDKDTLIKVPAQIFSEVNEYAYLENTKVAYKKVLDYFPRSFVARTQFKRTDGINTISQQFIDGDDSFLVGFKVRNKRLIAYLGKFLDSALTMLDEHEWLPDFDVKKVDEGFTLRNVVIEKDSFTPKIIDFTSYYDVYQLYEQRKNYEVKEKAKRIKTFIKWLNLVG